MAEQRPGASRRTRRHARRYGVALAVWGVAVGVRIALDAAFGSNPFFTPFYPAVLLAAWWGGLGPGLLVVGLSLASGTPLWIRGGGAALGAEEWLLVAGAGSTMVLVVCGIELLHRERRHAETSRRAARRRAAELAEAGRRREEFVAMLAHELRSPLHALLATWELVPDASSKAELDRLREVAQRHGSRIRRTLEGLLDVSSVLRGRAPVRRQRIDDLRIVLDRALQAADVEGRGRQLRVSRPTRALPLEGDPDRLEQGLFDLIDNAVKYTGAGGHVAVELRDEGQRASFRVRDDGCGVPDALGERAFELFTQGETSSDRPEGGLGIGLFLVRWVFEAHGGRVSLHSEGKGQGTTVTAELPLAPAAARAPDSGRAPTDTAGGPGRSGRRVLIVDDDPDSAWSLARLLERDGHTTATAGAADAALACYASFWPDVVVSDIGLPGMDGFGLAMEIRRRAWPEPPLLIALTGYGDDTTRRRAEVSGFRHHLLKPVRLDELRHALAGEPRPSDEAGPPVDDEPPAHTLRSGGAG